MKYRFIDEIEDTELEQSKSSISFWYFSLTLMILNHRLDTERKY